MEKFKEKYIELAYKYAEVSSEVFEKALEGKKASSSQKKANDLHAQIKEICMEALKQGELENIAEYMANDNKYIRFLTASFCIFIMPEKAVPVLEALMELPKPEGVSGQAFGILYAWKAGAMKI